MLSSCGDTALKLMVCASFDGPICVCAWPSRKSSIHLDINMLDRLETRPVRSLCTSTNYCLHVGDICGKPLVNVL